MRKNRLAFSLVCLVVLLVGCTPSNPTPTPTPTLEKPASFNAVVGSSSSVGLTWKKVDAAKRYELERKIADASFVALATQTHEVGGALSQSLTDTALIAATRYTYRVRAVNDQASSDWVVSAEVQTSATATTKYRVRGNWLGASNPNLYIATDTGVNYSGATMSLNGTALSFRASPGSYYASSVPGATTGTVLNLSITVPEGTIVAQGSIPQTPVISAPAANANITAGQALTVTWTYLGTDPDRFYLQLLGATPVNFISANIPGTARSLTIPASEVKVPSSGLVSMSLRAVNDAKGSFTGPVVADSFMGIASATDIQFNIVP